MIVVSFLSTIYYDIVISWAVFYLFASFNSHLPWEECDYSWADYRCEMVRTNCSSDIFEVKGIDGLCYNSSSLGFPTSTETIIAESNLPERNLSTVLGFWNESAAKHYGVQSVLATEQYWQ